MDGESEREKRMRFLVTVVAAVSLVEGSSVLAGDTAVRRARSVAPAQKSGGRAGSLRPELAAGMAFDTYIKMLTGCGDSPAITMTTSDWLTVRPRALGRPGVFDRGHEYFRGGDCVIGPTDPPRVSELRVRTYGADTAIFVGRFDLAGDEGSQQFTSVWVRQNGTWLEASQHVSKIPAGY